MIPIIDFGSQYTRLICRKIRQLGVNSRVYPSSTPMSQVSGKIYGIILSGSPSSAAAEKALSPHESVFKLGVPVLGICYGMHILVNHMGGRVGKGNEGEYGSSFINIRKKSLLFNNIQDKSRVWMSHGDTILKLPETFEVTASSPDLERAAIEYPEKKLYGLQFHPEVAHTTDGKQLLENFVFKICGAPSDWDLGDWIKESVREIKKQVSGGRVIMALSGGVDSSVASALVARAAGKDFYPVFVNHGLMREKDLTRINEVFIQKLGIKVKVVDASSRFFRALKGVSDPEQKRKIIGKEFIDLFTREAKKIRGITHLAQGTIFPDIIESAASGDGSAKIKSHHNVGGLPEKLDLELIEPLRLLYKDEVREAGLKLGLPEALIRQHPFPGPGLAVRILGPVDREKADILRIADEIIDEELKEGGIYYSLWQAFSVFLPVKSVGVMGDARTYENVLALRFVKSSDAMTASWAPLPHRVLERISTRIVNSISGINRVVYDVTNKPPGTIEWE